MSAALAKTLAVERFTPAIVAIVLLLLLLVAVVVHQWGLMLEDMIMQVKINGLCDSLGTHTRYHVRTIHWLPHHTNLEILLKTSHVSKFVFL